MHEHGRPVQTVALSLALLRQRLATRDRGLRLIGLAVAPRRSDMVALQEDDVAVAAH